MDMRYKICIIISIHAILCMHVLLTVSWGHSEIKYKVKQRSNSTLLKAYYLVEIDTKQRQGNGEKKTRRQRQNNETTTRRKHWKWAGYKTSAEEKVCKNENDTSNESVWTTRNFEWHIVNGGNGKQKLVMDRCTYIFRGAPIENVLNE